MTERGAVGGARDKAQEAPRGGCAAWLPVMDIEITDPDIQDVIRDIFQRKPDLEPQPREGP